MIPANRDNVIKACKGDKNAFSELIQERKSDIYRIAYTYVKNEEEALEILHDTVYKALISVRKLKNVDCFNAWLSRIIVTCSLDFIKKRKKAIWSELYINGQEEAENIPDETADYDDVVSSLDIMSAIDRLDLNSKTIIMLKYFQDFTLVQISEILACPLGTIKTRLNRALKTLKVELEESK